MIFIKRKPVLVAYRAVGRIGCQASDAETVLIDHNQRTPAGRDLWQLFTADLKSKPERLKTAAPASTARRLFNYVARAKFDDLIQSQVGEAARLDAPDIISVNLVILETDGRCHGDV